MDSLSQIVLGAAVGEAVLGKKVGYKAAIWGAIAGTIPDLDVIPGNYMDIVDRMEFHRGITHSIVFCVAMAPLLGYLVSKLHKREGVEWKPWSWLFFWGLFTHPILDCYTTWGTQLLWPFDLRIAWKSIFVVDPVYTLPFLLFTIMAIARKRTDPKRKKWNTIGLVVSTAYLMFTVVNKLFIIDPAFEQAMQEQKIQYEAYETRPAPLQNILWTMNAKTDSGYYIGYYSWFDENTTQMPLNYHAQNHELLGKWADHPKVKRLIALTDGYYIIEQDGEDLIFSDLRFGQLNAWRNPQSPFLFAFRLHAEGEKLIITEAERDRSVNSEFFGQYWQRIWGKRFL